MRESTGIVERRAEILWTPHDRSTEELRSRPVLFGPVIGILPMDGLTGSKQCPEKG